MEGLTTPLYHRAIRGIAKCDTLVACFPACVWQPNGWHMGLCAGIFLESGSNSASDLLCGSLSCLGLGDGDNITTISA